MFETEVRRDGAPARAAVETLPTGASQIAVPPGPGTGLYRRDRWFPFVVFALVAGAVVAVSILAHAHLSRLHPFHRQLQGDGWADAFGWWDGWWYTGIARRGYRFFQPDRQSPVAFFPGFPLGIRALAAVLGSHLVAGFLLALANGLGVAVLFHRWCVAKLGPDRARLALMLLLLYPFSFYLMGAVYADGLFIVASLAAFLALERDRPVLAGLAGIVATASRPVGTALVLGLWILFLERRGIVGRLRGVATTGATGWRGLRSRLRPGDAGLLLAPLGLVGFCGFLWLRFGSPFAFFDVAGAPGWDQPPGFHTWFKVHWVKAMWNGPWTDGHFGHLFVNAVATVITVAFIPAVFRRFGWGYGVYVTIAVVVTAAATKDFVGMGRYSLAAFPCFAVAADMLFRRPRLAWAVLGVSGAGLIMLTQLHARGTIVS